MVVLLHNLLVVIIVLFTMQLIATLCVIGLILTQFYVTIKVEYFGHHEPWAYLRQSDRVTSSTVTIFRVSLLFLQAIQLILHFHLFHLCYYLFIATLVCWFFPYLRKPSPYLPHCYHGGRRFWVDPLVTTSAVYMAAGIVALWNAQYPIAYLCVLTTIGSISYHRHREGQFFNFDNIFACTHFLIYGYSFYDSYDQNFYYFLLGVFGFPIPIYFLNQCGDPADIVFLRENNNVTVTANDYSSKHRADGIDQSAFTIDRNTMDCYSFLRDRHPHPIIRYSRKTYELLHLCWHFTSGMGPFIAMLYFAHYETPTMMDLSHLGIHDKEVLPIVGLTISLSLNLIANYFAAAPLH